MNHARARLSYANVMSTVAVFLALAGGTYAAASSITGSGGVIHSCYQLKRGTLRVVHAGTKCPHGEGALAFNERGPQGPRGLGSSTLKASVPVAAKLTYSPLKTLRSGIAIKGACYSGRVWIDIQAVNKPDEIEIVGTAFENEKPYPENRNSFGSEIVAGTELAAFDVAVRDRKVGPAVRIDVQGTYGSPCRFWEMITPST